MDQFEIPLRRTVSSLGKPSLLVLFVIWLLGVSAGVIWLCRYNLIAGSPAVAQVSWPEEIGLSKALGRDTLVMVVHPDCPCSRASMSELTMLAANCKNELSIEILFAEPPGIAEKIESTELWQSAGHIRGATVIEDKDGRISHKLGAKTSGQVFLYDAGGTLRFSGGITDSRGHAGNNAGRSAIEAIVFQQEPRTTRTPVFGCALW